MNANAANAPAPAARDPGSRVGAVGAAAICGVAVGAAAATTGAAAGGVSIAGGTGTAPEAGGEPDEAGGTPAGAGGGARVVASSFGWNEEEVGSVKETAYGVVSPGSGTNATS